MVGRDAGEMGLKDEQVFGCSSVCLGSDPRGSQPRLEIPPASTTRGTPGTNATIYSAPPLCCDNAR